jgi:hypothetical protein
MTEEQNALARRAVACKGWRWLPGMRVEWVGMSTGWRMLSETQSWYEREGCEDGEPGGPNALPDLTDPATLGCLLALVREAWGEFGMETFVRHLVGGMARSPCWVAQTRDRFGWNAYEGSSEAEALVHALEIAP